MRHDEFIGHVQDRAKLPSRGEAERLSGGEPSDAASQLPRGLAVYLTHERSGIGARLDRGEFLEVIAEREGVPRPDAAHHARGAFEVLREALTSGEVDGIRSQLPTDLRELFDAGGEGRLRGTGPTAASGTGRGAP